MRLVDADTLPYENQVLSYDEEEWCLKVSDIEEAPTIDAVEVVRCKDCRNCIMVGDRPYCDFWERNTEMDWYCSQSS